MNAIGSSSVPPQLINVVRQGEGRTLEFKRSTAELQGAMRTVCAFLNGAGGRVVIGVGPNGRLVGQEISDATQQKIAAALDRFEPPVQVGMEIVDLGQGRRVIVLDAGAGDVSSPFSFEGRAYERIGTTTRKMPQSRYERLLLERGHAKRRWENLPAEGLSLDDLDRQEILRTRELAVQQNRISPATRAEPGEILDRLGLRVDGVLTQAAQVLYGKRFLPNYPQCLLKLGRFRGATITGEIVDNRQEHMNAFAMIREGMAFLERTMPLGARFPTGRIFREDRFPVPLEALREILLNAVMHRDYSHYSGHVAIVVFDDRIEIRSYGRLPTGVTVEELSGPHLSRPTNPLIAEAFHRTGAVEIWGRGTNRVVEMCQTYGARPPAFETRQDFLIVTFKAQMVAGSDAEVSDSRASPANKQPESQPGSQPGSQPESLQNAVLSLLKRGALSKSEISTALGQKEISGQLNKVIRMLVAKGQIEYTLPAKPASRMQKYRRTDKA